MIDEDEERGQWVRHPGTVKAMRRTESEAAAALLDLMSRCAASTDPSVRASHARYEERLKAYRALGGKV